MNRRPLRPVTEAEARAFARDGVVVLRGVFDRDWLALLERGIERNLREPGAVGRDYANDGDQRFFYDTCNWRDFAEYRKFIFESPAAEIAAALLGSTRVNFLFETIFYRTPGTQKSTPWHQDEPYWPVGGMQAASIWIPCGGVEKNSALEFVPGSHRWQKNFRLHNFADDNPTGRGTVFTVTDAPGSEEFPDVEARRDELGVVSWALEPGDCTVHNPRIIHGGGGRLAAGRGLKIFNTQWMGDDYVVRYRESGLDPDISGAMRAAGLRDGDSVDCDFFPRVWPRETPGKTAGKGKDAAAA
ncbi:MAG: phytanoyl-CoA dioxygenase family protein [Gammaproteobacteria bacterium]|nr:phytanoyl-CoA dioxygenase family protein [Gammaproteobacteria bacterium]